MAKKESNHKVTNRDMSRWNGGLNLILNELNLSLDTQWKIGKFKADLESAADIYRKVKDTIDKKFSCKEVKVPMAFGGGTQIESPEVKVNEDGSLDYTEKENYQSEVDELLDKEIDLVPVRFKLDDFKGISDPSNEGKILKPNIAPRFYTLMQDLIDEGKK